MEAEYSVAVAKYDYKAESDGELTIRKNEKLTIIDDSQPWWKVQNEKSHSGYVPSNYLNRKDSVNKKPKFLDKIAGSLNPSKNKKRTSFEDAAVSDSQSPKLGSKGKVLMVATAKFKYVPQRDDEIELSPGDTVQVLEIEHDGWCRGESGGKTGWFPYNYITKSERGESGGSEYEAPENVVVDKPIICKVRTLYPFTSQSSEELSFGKDTILEVIDMPKDDPDWYQARKSSGEIGLIPRNYVETIVSPVLTPGPTKPKPSLPDPSKLQNNSVKSPSPSSTLQHQPPMSAPSADIGGVGSPGGGPGGVSPFADRDWYFGNISRKEGEKLLCNQDGEYLIRNSESKVKLICLTLGVLSMKGKYSGCIRPRGGGDR